MIESDSQTTTKSTEFSGSQDLHPITSTIIYNELSRSVVAERKIN